MSHLPATENRPVAWYLRPLFWLQVRRYGRELAPSRLWARTPRVFLALSAIYGALDRKSSPLDPTLRSLLQVRVSQINACAFCMDINSANGLARGLSADKLAALTGFAHSPLYSAAEKAALQFAETVTESGRRSDVTLIDRLRQHFSEDAIVELAALVSFQNMTSKFNEALGVASQNFCAAPPPPT